MIKEQINEYIQKNLSAKRYRHSLSVAGEAQSLAALYGADTDKAYLAGLLHDCAKELDETELHNRLIEYSKEDIFNRYSFPLLHGPVAACMMKNEFDIDDEEIYDAVWYHTTGKADMPLLTKILYLADFIEPNRKFDGVDKVRIFAEDNIDKAIIKASTIVIESTLKRGIPTDIDTVLARNYLLDNLQEKEIDFWV